MRLAEAHIGEHVSKSMMHATPRFAAVFALILTASVCPRGHVSAQTREHDKGGHGFGVFEPPAAPCLTTEQREWIRVQINRNRDELAAKGKLPARSQSAVLFEWPLRPLGSAGDASGYHGISNFVDQDPAFPDQLLDYECGARTYDLSSGYNHRGIDYFLWPFPWIWKDNDEVHIVAAAAGTIVLKQGGNADESCSFSSTPWNAVFVEHADGSVAWYGHMKRFSLTNKQVGQTVDVGEFLGVVGSSGSSTTPHLHFEIYDADNNLIEPYAGPCNSLNAQSWWADQRPYYDSAVNRLLIGNAAPQFPACPGRFVMNETISIEPGSTGYFTTFYRDQLDSQLSEYRILRPDGTTYLSWVHSSNASHYAASWWWWSWSIVASAPTGIWTFEVVYNGATYSKHFIVGGTSDANADIPAPRVVLDQNRPNPFNPQTTLTFSLPEATHATLEIYDVRGRIVRTLLNGKEPAGLRSIHWDGRDRQGAAMASGLYFYRLRAGEHVFTKTMSLMR